ncbi:MAG: CAP domain-containing protein [Bacteroidales bacterium]|nr:CAP domain-containing protein [Bacteroidales bacterium]MBR2199255.1 CAP domain-containing protein [Bacteroidales bacterium]MBR3713155.1 CAP domain-containing protein [Bacteroidales bacterium]MBR4271812.1 CAP domain-containing protein [Bacteroidales bacterium]
MKKIYYLGIVAVIGLALLTMSYTCSEDEGDDPTTEPTSDNTKPDNQTTDNNGTNNGTENNSNTENNGTENTNSSAFTEAEIAKANTAANIASLSQMEKDIILYCNLARLDGAKFWAEYGSNAKGSNAYVSSLESDLKAVKDLAMLVPEKSLMEAAAYHAKDMSDNNFFDHTSSDGTSFGNRVYSFYGGGAIAENISAGMGTAIGVVMQLLVDDGLSSLGHRKNILGTKYVAIGVKTATHSQWRTVTVQDFGDKVITKME